MTHRHEAQAPNRYQCSQSLLKAPTRSHTQPERSKTMITTALFLGFASALGIFIVLLRAPRMLVLRIFGHAWLLDITLSFLMFAMHWGTAIGAFSAVIAALFCSAGITLCKYCLGYIKGGTYYAGWFGDTRPFNKRCPQTIAKRTTKL